MEQKTKKGCLWMVFSIIILIIIIALSVAIHESNTEKKDKQIEAQIEECIENEDYSKAKQLAATMDIGMYMECKICRAQVSSLIKKGEYDLAGDIAREDGDYGIYVNIILDRLTSIYNSDKQSIVYVLSTLSFPEKGYSGYWGGKTEVFSEYDLNNYISNYNEALTSLMEFAKTNNDRETLKQVASFLKPKYTCKEKWVKKSDYVDGGYMTHEFSDTPNDYSEVKKIKQRFGI